MEEGEELIRDLTVGSVPKTLISFAMRLFLSGLLQTVYNMADMIIVGRFVGTQGLSSVSIGGEILMFLTFLAMGFSNAGQILISRHVGEKRRDRVSRMIGTLFTFLFLVALVIMVFFLFTYRHIIHWLNTPDEIFEMTRQYTVTCVYGIVFIYGYNLVSAILRGMGDSKHPFLFIAIASLVNIVLDLLFVASLHMGPFGAALATVIGQAVSFLFALSLLYRKKEQFCFDFRRRSFRIFPEEFDELLKLGIPMSIQSAAITFSMLVVNSFINTYGTTAVAVTGVAKKLESMLNIISQAMSSAGGAMISQSLGAGKVDRVPKVVYHAIWIVAIPAAVFALITGLHPEWLFGLFSSDPAVLAMAVEYIPVAMIQYLGAALRPANFALINGSGNSRLNLTVALVDGIICRIGLAFLLGTVAGMGIRGFWYGNALSGLVPFFVGSIHLISGSWKESASKVHIMNYPENGEEQ